MSVGAMYGLLMVLHQPFTLIFSLLIICVLRGGMLWLFERGFYLRKFGHRAVKASGWKNAGDARCGDACPCSTSGWRHHLREPARTAGSAIAR